MGFMQHFCSLLGVSEAVGKFLITFLATIPCCYLNSLLKNVTLRHAFAAFSGAVLSYVAFGSSANLHFTFTVIVAYLSMVQSPRRCGPITFFASFTFLIICHVWYMSGEAWQEGGIDFTGALMILTLKVISVATDYQDGQCADEDLNETQKYRKLSERPSFLEFIGFSFCCGTHLAGPVCAMQDYLRWQRSQGLWDPKQSRPPPPPLRAAGRALIQALISACIHIYLETFVDLKFFSSSEYQNSPVWLCWFYLFVAAFSCRWKYYFIWSISESALILSGLGFSGWEEERETKGWKARWDRAKNCNILGVELADSAIHFPLNWNISVSSWLRIYIYERLTPRGRKAGFWELLATQIVSAVWHGLYPGYLHYFVGSALMIAGSRVIYRFQKTIPKNMGMVPMVAKVCHGFYASFVNNYAAAGFLLLSNRDTVLAYKGVYFLGTIIPLAILILGAVVPPPRPRRAKKEE